MKQEANIDDLPYEARMRVVRDSEGGCIYCAQLEGERHRKDCRYRKNPQAPCPYCKQTGGHAVNCFAPTTSMEKEDGCVLDDFSDVSGSDNRRVDYGADSEKRPSASELVTPSPMQELVQRLRAGAYASPNFEDANVMAEAAAALDRYARHEQTLADNGLTHTSAIAQIICDKQTIAALRAENERLRGIVDDSWLKSEGEK